MLNLDNIVTFTSLVVQINLFINILSFKIDFNLQISFLVVFICIFLYLFVSAYYSNAQKKIKTIELNEKIAQVTYSVRPSELGKRAQQMKPALQQTKPSAREN